MDDEKEYWQLFYFWDSTSRNVLLLINLLAGIVCLVLYWSRRTDTEYLWFGASELFRVANILRLDYVALHDVSYNYTNLLGDILSIGALFCFLQFLMVLLKGHRGILYWVAITVGLARLLVSVPLGLEWIHLPLWFAWGGWVLIYFPAYLCMLIILIVSDHLKT